MFRPFNNHQRKLCAQWSRDVMTLDEWKPESAVKPGEAGVRRAICKRQAAYLKKAVSSDGCHRAAHEKIAGDLANALGFAVPPVLLFRDADGERYALSLEIFEQPMTLAEIKRLGQWNAASPTLARTYRRRLCFIRGSWTPTGVITTSSSTPPLRKQSFQSPSSTIHSL
ncbi:MAG: hypothetical protein HZY79_15175 [Rhodoblastus sp.]|nr:MAG: hypothetical protein HZY79_15175 [Rhodoblastus sp.]